MSKRKPLATMVDDSSNTRVDLYDDHIVRIWQVSGGQVYMTVEQMARFFSFVALHVTKPPREAGGDE